MEQFDHRKRQRRTDDQGNFRNLVRARPSDRGHGGGRDAT